MKNNYKISVGAPQISEDQIDRHRDFESVLQRYNSITQPLYKRPLYKNPKAFLGLVLILVIGALVFIAVKEEKTPGRYLENLEGGGKVFVETPYVNPLAPIDFPEQSFLVSTVDEVPVELAPGLRLIVPKGAFGPQAPAQVEIKFRELSNPVDRLAAGVPSQFDKDGYLRSLALFDLRAYGPQGELSLAEGMELRLEWTAFDQQVSGERLYFLDAVNRRWVSVAAPIQYQTPAMESVKEVPREMSDGFQIKDLTGADSTEFAKPVPKVGNPSRQGKAETLLLRTLSLNKMGFWEVAVPSTMGERKTARVNFVDIAGNPLDFTTIYVITEGQDAVYMAWNTVSDPSFELIFDGKRSNKAIGVTLDGKFAFMGSHDFARLANGAKEQVTMVMVEEKMNTPEKLMDLLSFGRYVE